MDEIEHTISCDITDYKAAITYYRQHMKHHNNQRFKFYSKYGCEEKCEGWNGIDKRCDCGNYRVMWVWSDDQLYAEAY